MTILSSREKSCIQNTDQNKTKFCNDLLEKHKGGCAFNKQEGKDTLCYKMTNTSEPWDLEDLVKNGVEEGACPYFSARSMMEHADIIFCPYNYILDPFIKNSMKINLKGNIVIFDEAHNIEDICRNVASVNIASDVLEMIMNDCSQEKNPLGENVILNNIEEYIRKLLKFIQDQKISHRNNNSDRTSESWSGEELAHLLQLYGLGGANFHAFSANVQVAFQDQNSRENKEDTSTMSDGTTRNLEQILFGLNDIISKSQDYKACIVETIKTNKQQDFLLNNWQQIRNRSNVVSQRVRILQIMCMNSACIFKPISKEARTVILASGTLSPTSSFQSELGTTFPHLLNANHVISKDQVLVQYVPYGPSGTEMKAVYEKVNSMIFMDDLGKIILKICETVPKGVLCFFSSYSMMVKQIDRWKITSTWSKIKECKRVFLEPQSSLVMDEFMEAYRHSINCTVNNSLDEKNGSIMFAVFRGKVAEGIDFSDDEARCVVTVGIPYASYRDPPTQLKKNYNDNNISKGLLPGHEWYKIQAFRALNQALGRCIRHRNDWGAIILIDSRFREFNNFYYLPKWIKSFWTNNCGDLEKNLISFIEKQKK